ncbi:MAG TPA: DUF1801 domain-containing protein [Phenylobacterium sp.]|jgi:hypothetical protein|nr:DUF1801 domain-containing protein [Phenylobacterium sp.]
MPDGGQDAAVTAVFEAYPPDLRAALLGLRRLILETAAETPGVGALTEALRWKQPSYLTEQSGSGTTIRIDAVKGSADNYALYVNCKTTLLEGYRHLYPDAFRFEGNRALVFSTKAPPPEAALRHCIALALTYHKAATAA